MGQDILKCGSRNLLKSGAIVTTSAVGIAKWGSFVTKWGKNYYKVGQIIYYIVGQSLLERGVDTTKWENFITNWGRYCNKRQSLQSRDLHRTKVTSRSRLEKSIVLLYSSSLPT